MTPAEIAAEYYKREEAAGGLSHADPRAIAHSIADDFGLTYERVRDALLDRLTMTGGA